MTALIRRPLWSSWVAPPGPEPEERQKNPAAVALGKLGASKGGKARAARLSAARKSEIARKAAEAKAGGAMEFRRSSTLTVVLAWAAVSLPLAWGVWNTVEKALVLFTG
jgi:hypothetical protein